ncbi:MAG TPA: helix-turn-helix domain-containing protein [Pseudomonadales bacterium]|nr:helix-turn-helix domain-containing protein [Pseudomonadales bacterium]
MTAERRGGLDDGESAADAAEGVKDAQEGLDGAEPAADRESLAELTLGPPGARLRAAREARGLSLDDLARTMNLSRRVFEALEADDYDTLPSPTFVRGYIKSLARLLGEAPQPLLDAYEARGGAIRLNVRPTPGGDAGRMGPSLAQRRPGLVMVTVTLGILLALAGLALAFWPAAVPGVDRSASGSRGSAPAAIGTAGVRVPSGAGPSAEVAPAPAGATAALAGDAAEASAGPGAATVAPSTAAARGAAAVQAPAPAADAPVASDDAAPAVAIETAGDGSNIVVEAGGEDHLRFTFSDDCWVEVRDGDDRAVYQNLNRAGQTLDLWGRAPFRIRLGFAPAVQLAYNDSRVPLAPYTRNDVAALVIGR